MASEVTVGIDIGTTSVKAVAADADGRVVGRGARVPHPLKAGHAGELAHDPGLAWRDGVLRALAEVASRPRRGRGVGRRDGAVAVRGRRRRASRCPTGCSTAMHAAPGGEPTKNPSESGELVRFLAWLVDAYPDAAGFWPAQAVANHALCGEGVIDTVVAMTTLPLFDFTGWDAAVAAAAGLHRHDPPAATSAADTTRSARSMRQAARCSGPARSTRTASSSWPAPTNDGDVLVILGSTLIVWVGRPGVDRGRRRCGPCRTRLPARRSSADRRTLVVCS